MSKVRLPLTQITPGMKLAEPITNASGITLMPAGIRLTPMFIARIKKWNVEAIDVIMDKKQEPGVEIPSPVTTQIRRLKPDTQLQRRQEAGLLSAEQQEFARTVAVSVSRVFVNVKNNPLMMQLRAIAIKRLILHGQDGAINLIRRPRENEEGGADGT